MDRFSQYEVQVPSGARWTMIACFEDFDVAYAVASSHGGHVRLVLASYDHGQLVAEEVVAEVGLSPQ